jgi:Fe-Mn family superoxide dismutase
MYLVNPQFPSEHTRTQKEQSMPFAVPPLPYAYDALEPHIDDQTMHLHHDMHHQAYVDKVNAALAGTEHAERPIDELVADLGSVPEEKRAAVRNNGGGHFNHTLFWESMSPDGGGAPEGELAAAIDSAFGSFDSFKEQFEAAGVARFGSGWVWLVADGDSVAIVTTANQDNPVADGRQPLLGNDVWEHAYYLKYQNRRPEYLGAWWSTVDWGKVAERHEGAKGSRR